MKVSDTIISLSNMRFHAYHGVFPQEQLTGGEYLVSIDIHCDVSEACKSDNLGYTINYAEVYNIVKNIMQHSYKLIERVAYLIGESLISEYDKINSVDISLTKLNPPMGGLSDGATIRLKIKR